MVSLQSGIFSLLFSFSRHEAHGIDDFVVQRGLGCEGFFFLQANFSTTTNKYLLARRGIAYSI